MRRNLTSLSILLIVAIGAAWPIGAMAASQPRLGTATSFAVLAAAGISNSGTTNITGDVGTFPTTSETGFAGPAPNTVTLAPGSVNHDGDAVTQGARVDEVTAYNDLANQTPCTVLAGGALDGRNLIPGCYKFSSSAILNVGQTLTLSGFGIYVFQIGSALTIGNGTQVILSNGAVACGVFWQVTSSATIGTAPTNFQGTLIAGTSISVNTGATWTGRALAGALVTSGAVTLLGNTITRPAAACSALPTVVSASTVLPTPTVALGNTGVPSDLRGGIPWQLILVGAAGGLGALMLGLSIRARRRTD